MSNGNTRDLNDPLRLEPGGHWVDYGREPLDECPDEPGDPVEQMAPANKTENVLILVVLGVGAVFFAAFVWATTLL